MIYVISTGNANRRPVVPESISVQNSEFLLEDGDVERIITFSMREEKQAAARELLIMLVASGVMIEISVVLISYFMAEQAIRPVKEAYQAQKIFIANASHEIKTPLAAISANLEAADLSQNKWIHNVELETAKLTSLNAELLTLARSDIMNESRAEEVNLREMTTREVKMFEQRMKNIQYNFKNTAPEKVKISADDFRQILGILMDNAIKYCDGLIDLKVGAHELEIKNDGKKIGTDELAHVFERFYQTDKTKEGVGLGLSIAKSVAERNHWKLSVECKKDVVFRFEF
ncbi:HAMP domain-containing histidine kinase [Candidatus Saccharibacteria bacterium]|nr:HAMP domain-containing histidine kinase [Candidatus Saccharibacteria bacterium]